MRERVGGTRGGFGVSCSATNPRPRNAEAVINWPELIRPIATRGKFGAYLSLKFRLPATRVAPLAVGSAPAPFRSRRAKSLSSSPAIATHAWKFPGEVCKVRNTAGARQTSVAGARSSSWMNVTAGPCGRTITLRCLVGASSSIRGRFRARSLKLMPRRNHSFSPAHVVQVTSNRVAPTLAKASSIARASLCSIPASSPSMAPPCFISHFRLFVSKRPLGSVLAVQVVDRLRYERRVVELEPRSQDGDLLFGRVGNIAAEVLELGTSWQLAFAFSRPDGLWRCFWLRGGWRRYRNCRNGRGRRGGFGIHRFQKISRFRPVSHQAAPFSMCMCAFVLICNSAQIHFHKAATSSAARLRGSNSCAVS